MVLAEGSATLYCLSRTWNVDLEDCTGLYTINGRERHIFFARDLLEHLLKLIVRLKRTSTCYWGCIPKCDL